MGIYVVVLWWSWSVIPRWGCGRGLWPRCVKSSKYRPARAFEGIRLRNATNLCARECWKLVRNHIRTTSISSFDDINRPGTLTHKMQLPLFDGSRVVRVERWVFQGLPSGVSTMESFSVHVGLVEQRKQNWNAYHRYTKRCSQYSRGMVPCGHRLLLRKCRASSCVCKPS